MYPFELPFLFMYFKFIFTRTNALYGRNEASHFNNQKMELHGQIAVLHILWFFNLRHIFRYLGETSVH